MLFFRPKEFMQAKNKINFKKQDVIHLSTKKKASSSKEKPIQAVGIEDKVKQIDINVEQEGIRDDWIRFVRFLKELPKNEALNKVLKNKYFRKIAAFVSVYFLIYFLISSPTYYARIKYLFKDKTTKVITQEVVTTPMADSAALDPGETIPAGASLIVPKLDLNVPIVLLDTFEESKVQDGLKRGVVKIGGTVNPGEVGNSFIAGHSSGYFWDNNPYKFAFVLLDKLEPGDDAKIYYNNRKFVYKVTEKKIVDPTDTSVVAQTDEPYITLMTCYPPGTISKRLIVRLKQVQPVYEKPKIITKEKEMEAPKILPSVTNKSFWEKILFFWE